MAKEQMGYVRKHRNVTTVRSGNMDKNSNIHMEAQKYLHI